jgi:hypothetical protein
MKKIFLLLFFFLPVALIAQVPAPTIQRLKVYEGVCEVNSIVSMQKDGGFIFSIEASQNYGNIDSLCTMTVDRMIFIKYNSDATIQQWAKCYAGNASDSLFIFMDSTIDGNYILGGLQTGSSHEFLIHKEDATGTILWSKTYGDSSEVIIKSMMATEDSGYILLGEVYYTNSDFPVHYSTYGTNLAVLRINNDGNKVWSKVVGGTGEEAPGAIISAPGDGCYIVGTTTSNDYDCTGNHGASDGYVARMDKSGNLIWHNDLGGSGYDDGYCGWPDGKGGILVIGYDGSTDGDITHIPSFGCAVWLTDLDSNGNISWYSCFGGGGGEYPNSLCKAADGSIWIAGVSAYTGGEVDTNYGRADAWFIHADSAGNFLSAKVLGSDQDDEGTMIYPLSNNNVMAGGYYDTTGGSFPFISWGDGGAFLTVFEQGLEGIQKISMLDNNLTIYPNPTNSITTIKAKDKNNIIITDAVGRILYNKNIQNKIEIQVNGWQKGIYFVQAISEEGYKEVKKLIVE